MPSQFEIAKDDPAIGAEVASWQNGETYTIQVKQISSDKTSAKFEVVGVGEVEPVEEEVEEEYEEELPVKSPKPPMKIGKT